MKFFNNRLNTSLIILIISTLMMGSCRKALDYTPEVFLGAEQVYKDQAGATAGITGIYKQLQSLKSSDYALIGIIGTDEARCTYQSQGYGAYWAGVTGLDVYDIQFSSQNNGISGYWRTAYQGIANANYAIQYIPKIKNFSDVSLQNRLLGEAYFMRALFYFQLVQLYGDIPLRLENMSFSDGVKRSPAADVYAQIISDLKFASANCWARNKNPEPGRASVEAAKTLLGKVYLTQHDYQQAKTTFEEVLPGLTLLPEYADLFDGKHENNAESIFEIQYSTESGNTNSLQNLFGSYAGPTIPFTTFNNHTPGNGGSIVTSTHFYADLVFDKIKDKRYAASINYDRYDSNGQKMSWWIDPGLPTLKKYDITSSDIDVSNSGKNLYYLRAADVFLMYAEVLNELSQSAPALVPLNKVRSRAGLPELQITMGHTPSQTELRAELLDERTRELGGEGWRWFDLKRTGTLVEKVMAYNNPKAYYMALNNTTTDPHPAQNVSAKNNLYPIPLAELQNNQALNLNSQNPGY